MPYANRDDKLKQMRRWRVEKMKQGYGKALYARRKQRYANEERLRKGVVQAILLLEARSLYTALDVLRDALADAPPIGPVMEYMPTKDQREVQ